MHTQVEIGPEFPAMGRANRTPKESDAPADEIDLALRQELADVVRASVTFLRIEARIVMERLRCVEVADPDQHAAMPLTIIVSPSATQYTVPVRVSVN